MLRRGIRCVSPRAAPSPPRSSAALGARRRPKSESVRSACVVRFSVYPPADDENPGVHPRRIMLPPAPCLPRWTIVESGRSVEDHPPRGEETGVRCAVVRGRPLPPSAPWIIHLPPPPKAPGERPPPVLESPQRGPSLPERNRQAPAPSTGNGHSDRLVEPFLWSRYLTAWGRVPSPRHARLGAPVVGLFSPRDSLSWIANKRSPYGPFARVRRWLPPPPSPPPSPPHGKHPPHGPGDAVVNR